MKTIYIVMGAWCWGKGLNIPEAKKQAKKLGGPFKKSDGWKASGWAVYSVTVEDEQEEKVYVDEMGSFCYPFGTEIKYVDGPDPIRKKKVKP